MLYWIDLPTQGRLAIMARPRANDWLEDQIKSWRDEGVGTVVSLLEAEEVVDLDLGAEEGLCRAQGMDFIKFPIPDRGLPASRNEAAAICRVLADRLAAGDAVAIHCRAGIGRSSLMAACTLFVAGFDPTLVLDAITSARGLTVPDTDAQRDWVLQFGQT
jgi:protein-tyrosine phosphatase